MVKISSLVFIVICISFSLLNAEVDKSLSAVELNTLGYQLYEQKKYVESLDYFRASFEKDPDYVYPHYNYACVLSLLCAQDEKKWSDYEWDITKHLLISMRLRANYRTKYFTDPDLKWYREKMDEHQTDPYAEGPTLNDFKPDSNSTSIREILIEEESWETGNSYVPYFSIASIRFNANGRVTINWRAGSEKGTYEIFGNIVYIEFNKPAEIETLTIKSFYLIVIDGYIRAFLSYPSEFDQFDPGSSDVDYGA
ncbi:MAG: hypothetical protein JW822_09175 [Spirochaetales bacterium]|nr:hypothetical protein [Spirochaetales bacterium]